MLKKNDIINVKVNDINYMGLGVARYENEVIFIQGGVTGDELEIKIIKTAKNYCIARIQKVIKQSEYRKEPECEISKRCGGCIYDNITYEYEAELKKQRVISEFNRFGLHGTDVNDVITVKNKGYRNKLQFPVDADGNVGFYANHTHDVIPVQNCCLQEEMLNPVYRFLCEKIKKNKIKTLRHIYLRCGVKTNEIMVCFVCSERHFKGDTELAKEITKKFANVKSVIINYNPDETNVVLGKECILLEGRNVIYDELCGVKFEIHPLSFYQVNPECTEVLYRTACEFADMKENETLLDLFCGIGTVGLCINKLTPVKKLKGIEIVAEAVENARKNAEINSVTNAEFYCMAAEKPEIEYSDAVVIDPPRKGCAKELIDKLGKAKPKRIVYISCSPDTLARDCQMLKEYGYVTEKVQPVNMFPRTGHIENVALITLK